MNRKFSKALIGTITALIASSCALAQSDAVPFVGSLNVVQVKKLGINGTITMTPLTLGANVSINSQNQIVSTAAPPPTTPPSQVTYLTLLVSAADPNTWCASAVTGGKPVYPSLVVEQISVSGGQLFPQMTIVAPQPVGSTGAGSPPPTFGQSLPNCSGNPGVIFPANALVAGETRAQAQLLVVF